MNSKSFALLPLPIIASAVLLTNFAAARPMKIWTSAELWDRSDFVVIGKPKEIRATGETGTIQLGEKGAKIPVRYYSAKIEVVEIIKGKTSARETSISYSRVNYAVLNPPVLVNGPGRIWLEEGELFLFYLKKSKEGMYVSALDGDFDDAQAVKLLTRSTDMKINAICEEKSDRNFIAFVCDPPVTRSFANELSGLANSVADGERSEFSFKEEEGRLLVSGFKHPPSPEFFAQVFSWFRTVASRREEMASKREEIHETILTRYSDASGLPIE